jgi:RNase P subunit RPR2
MENFSAKTCKNCGSMKFKTWEDLTDDEKFIIERLPDNSEFTIEQRKKHRFCKRCLYILIDENLIV